MRAGFHFAENLRDVAIFINDETRAFITPVFDSIKGILLPYAVCIGDLVAFVGKQGEIQVELLFKFLVRSDVVRADAEYEGVVRVEFLDAIANLARLFGATRRVVFGVEVEHDLFAAQVG